MSKNAMQHRNPEGHAMTSTTATLPSEVQYLDADTYTGRQTIRRTNARIPQKGH